jgi:replicative DNA helicase
MNPKSNLFNIEAELDVLGAMIADDESRLDILNMLTVDDFYEVNGANQLVFKAIDKLVKDGIVVDIPSLTNELGVNMKVLDSVGGVSFLVDLADRFISHNAAKFHAQNVQDLALARRLVSTLNKYSNGFEKKEFANVLDYVSECEDEVIKIAKNRRTSGFEEVGDVVDVLKKNIQDSLQNKGKGNNRNVPTGFKVLDYITKGWQPGQFNIIGARPSVGKTAFAINLAYNAASLTGKTVAFFSLEMDAKSITKRMLSMVSMVSGDAIDHGKLTDGDWMALDNAVKALKNCKLLIDDTPGEKLNEIKAKVHKLKSQSPDLCCIFIDYLGLITTNNTKVDNRQLEVADISRQLKALAREVEVPIICLSQLSRANEQRSSGERMPKLTDLRDSGSIEQDADIVMFVHRESYQNEKAQKEKEGEDITNTDPYASTDETTISIAKNRNGKTGYLKYTMLMNVGKFVEVDQRNEQEGI